jgi:hypothetical protein
MGEEAISSGRHDSLGEVIMLLGPAISRSRASHLLESNTKELVRGCLQTANSKTLRFLRWARVMKADEVSSPKPPRRGDPRRGKASLAERGVAVGR